MSYVSPKWDYRFLELARHVSTWSKDPSTQAGAVIVRPNRSICSVGFNGFPQKMDDLDEYYDNREEKYSRIIHAEMNALMFATDQSLRGYTIYIYPFMPCDRCMVHLVQKGITRFVAPMASTEQLKRWGSAFERTKTYAKESVVEVVELPFPLSGNQ